MASVGLMPSIFGSSRRSSSSSSVGVTVPGLRFLCCGFAAEGGLARDACAPVYMGNKAERRRCMAMRMKSLCSAM